MASPLTTGADEVVAGNVYPKYTTGNPIARRLVAHFLATLRHLVRQSGARQIHEVGCGEGFLSTMLAADGYRVRGSDLSAAAIATARQRAGRAGLAVDFAAIDLFDLEAERDSAELVVCCEVLEHVPDPARALAILARLARPHLLVSVPREPLWRVLNVARGRYWRELGNTPGHLQHWSTPAFFTALQDQLDVVALHTPIPWTMALCRARHR